MNSFSCLPFNNFGKFNSNLFIKMLHKQINDYADEKSGAEKNKNEK
jgi:hypothetical protein